MDGTMTAADAPKEAARRLAAGMIRGNFTPEALHTYRDAAGEPIFWRIRARLPNGKKWIRPMHLNGNGYTIGEPSFNGSRPLYRLHEVATADPASPVWFVEGEKCADALGRLGAVVTTCGSATDDERADFTPLAGRTVILWPDNDTPGIEHVDRVATKLRSLGANVTIIDIAPLGLAEHGDVCDYLEAHPSATAADLAALARLSEGKTPSVALIRGDQVFIEPVRWVWQGWLAAGKLHILAGAPGTGKTTIALALAAAITAGGRFPDGTHSSRGDVLIWSGEDDPGDTLAPRLKASGADLRRIRFVGAVVDADGVRAFDPARDMDRLRDAVHGAGITPRLLIVDPIVNAVAGDSHKNGEVRRDLAPLCELARELDCAVLGISHFTKGSSGRDPVERVTGSLAFGALARVVMAAAKRPDDQGGGRLLARAKSNIGPDGGGFAYSLEMLQLPDQSEVETSRVLWGAAIEGTARELLADADADPETGAETKDAADWLREVIEEAGGSIDAKEVKKLAKDAGFAERTIERSRARAGVQSERVGFGQGARYVWRMPATCSPCSPNKFVGGHGVHDGEHGLKVELEDF